MNKLSSASSERDIVDQVDELNEEVKVLALNLAIYLARAKGESDQLQKLEPDFIRLVNGSVKVVKELAAVISAARNDEAMALDQPASGNGRDQIEIRLRSLLDQCNKIMSALSNS